MLNDELRDKLSEAKSLEETKKRLAGHEGLDAERIYKEIENKRSSKSELLDLQELDAVSGGIENRDWEKDSCAATCEPSSWCWSNDLCEIFNVIYDNFWAICPDGHAHEFKDYVCVRCGYGYQGV